MAADLQGLKECEIKILFIDWAPFAYDGESPLKAPLGGTQSAAVFLALALASRGHQVEIINQIKETRVIGGVTFTQLPKATSWLNEFDVIVSVTGLHAETLRSVGCDRPVVAWCPHDVDQGAVASLRDREYQKHYAGFALVSEWQQQQYRVAFGIADEKSKVLRNAISLPFEKLTRKWDWLYQQRPPVFTYTSTPFRGLDVLLLAFPLIRRIIPEARLRIFGGMRIYSNAEADKPFQSLYELARVMSGVENIGPLGQQELSEALVSADLLTYPCTFRETSCISLMESCAAGLLAITTNFGALPETGANFAELVQEASPMERGNIAVFATRYAAQVVSVYEKAIADPDAMRSRLEAQMRHFQTENTWERRAIEWEEWLEQVI